MAGSKKSRTDKKHPIAVEAILYPQKRRNIPTAETQGLMQEAEAAPTPLLYPRNPDLDPQLVWKGKDKEDRGALRVDAVPIYIQEKIHPKAIVEDLKRVSVQKIEPQADLFADFNGIALEDKLDFYQHDQNWSNRMILGDSLMVMASLAEKEALRGKVQMIYIDPPYGIKFGSNWQVSTRDRDVKDGKAEYAPREPEVIKAFRDTWALGVHSYLSYLRDRLLLARDLLAASGSVFVQIGDENAHLVRALLDEVFGSNRFVSQIAFSKTTSSSSDELSSVVDYILWYSRGDTPKLRTIFQDKIAGEEGATQYAWGEDAVATRRTLREWQSLRVDPSSLRIFAHDNITSQRPVQGEDVRSFIFQGRKFAPEKGTFKTDAVGLARLAASNRMMFVGSTLRYVRYIEDFSIYPYTNVWTDTVISGFADPKVYVVQTSAKVIERCVLMTTDPGDLVLDPTCGSGTTANVAEQWGRRWITIDASRVALTLARQRLMAARFPWYLLRDSETGAQKEAEVTRRLPVADAKHSNDIRHGFVYERVPHVTLKSIANNAEIDVIHAKWQEPMEASRNRLNAVLGQVCEEWQVQHEASAAWPQLGRELHAEWQRMRRERQTEIDASIARNAEIELLYDRPYEARNVVRVTGPFTVESLSPHRLLAPEEDDDELLAAIREEAAEAGRPLPERRPLGVRPNGAREGDDDFVRVVLDNLAKAGVQNTKKNERLVFTSIEPWTGDGFLHAQGRYLERERERRAAIFIGPEYGTVSRDMVMRAAREARDVFDVLVVCGFAFDPHVGSETMSLGRLTVLKARMNEDLHMAEHLKKTGAANLFVVFGEPDIELQAADGGAFRVQIKGVDIFDPTTGEVRSSSDLAEDIACWFLDSDYDGDSFFVRHAYFLGRDPYERLKRSLKAEIDEGAWATLNSTESRPFPAPKSGRLAVKVINHYGDEVMKVFRI